ncbi:unnamed protein product [Linum trigynum]|uniref:Uncharacterized protein n=1 Tax=Linum trigynum TaxID=586398 RepID=A0AAV2CVL8_9ROSI
MVNVGLFKSSTNRPSHSLAPAILRLLTLDEIAKGKPQREAPKQLTQRLPTATPSPPTSSTARAPRRRRPDPEKQLRLSLDTILTLGEHPPAQTHRSSPPRLPQSHPDPGKYLPAAESPLAALNLLLTPIAITQHSPPLLLYSNSEGSRQKFLVPANQTRREQAKIGQQL